MNWSDFYLYAGGASLFWVAGSLLSWSRPSAYRYAISSYLCGLVLFSFFIGGLWISLERPPLRTMGETRLWYSFFMALSGILTYIRWRYRWILSFTTLMSIVFIIINLVKPEIHDKSLMPALQSGWFIPHVTIYMFAYAILGCAFLLAVFGLVKDKNDLLPVTDRLVSTGVAFLGTGMLLGSLWAKEAWGDYWSWDPKETWAFITWFGYLGYIHVRLKRGHRRNMAYGLLIFSFITLQMCWYGVNYLPAAKQSVHAYSRE